jgi:membrane-bound inhibitor of C-type lysozyme
MNKKIIFGSITFIIIIIFAYAIKVNNEIFVETLPTTPINTVTFMCDGNKKIYAEFYDSKTVQTSSEEQPPIPGGSVKINLDANTEMTLNQTISADGGRYANKDETFIFWTKGNGVMILENNLESSYKNCLAVAKNNEGEALSQIYKNQDSTFSIRLPEKYTIDAGYKYQLSPKKIFSGVKFTIPSELATGTNLGSDTYISAEQVPNATECNAKNFLDDPSIKETIFTDNNTTYSLATSTGAGAGNRYEESVYAIPGSSPCIAIRYFVHYSVFENYPKGSIQEFDKQKILDQFGSIRKTLILR